MIRGTSCDIRTRAAVPPCTKVGTQQSHLIPFPGKSRPVTLKQNIHHLKKAKLMLFGPSCFSLSGLPMDRISEVRCDLHLSYANATAI